MKAVVGAFNQEKALVGAFSVIVKTDRETDGSSEGLLQTDTHQHFNIISLFRFHGAMTSQPAVKISSCQMLECVNQNSLQSPVSILHTGNKHVQCNVKCKLKKV